MSGDTIVPVLNVTSRVFWLELDDKVLLDSYGVLQEGILCEVFSQKCSAASEDPTKLFSTPSMVKAEGGGTAVSAARPVADESDRLRGKVADLQLELEAMRKKLGEGGDADSVAPSALGSGGGRLELARVTAYAKPPKQRRPSASGTSFSD